ncbi:hypothetical protein [Leptospira santarosai]|uniref:hypothetical protein n=2 Tax=Leptospira santarosai TaxID=28183 RepID=UPI0024AF42C4|nr:hypothetical protein [Leptospira santarosai]MBW9231606.1 hypothetical protein [Leptospira santarosai]MDI7173686.1 hypothetical protein [Leptospira santarosai]MDI7193351.1 hypothetical protein [Leptospira santarosai]MDO6394517.1 hypothetical protein [Leptospira santarosai]MDO6397737.1 hypothetical protein [Leptospira santarosai]
MIVTDFFRILRSITKRKNSFYRNLHFDILPIMIILKALIVFEILIFGNLLLAQQTIQKSESDLEKKVAEEVKKIRELSGKSAWYLFNDELNAEPILKLKKMGMVIIPFLLPYLSDTSETHAVRAHGNGNRRVALVNEYIGYIINRIADHEFYLLGKTDDDIILLGDGGLIDIETIRAFQTLIANWYQKNKDKSLGERKLDDLQDGFHTNRFAAYQWLGKSRSEKYRLPLENKIKELFKGDSDTLKDSEMVDCATALGNIGNPKSAKILRKVANHLSYDYSGGERTPNIYNVFSAYEALAKLGHKKEALVRLNELKKDYLETMDGDTQKKFLENLKKAEKW